jgi:two-component system response regulator PilR (NtrC family)
MSKRLLLVESDKNILSCSRMLFQHYGFEVETAQTVEQAKESVAKNDYAVVVTELCLENREETEGLEIIRYVNTESPNTKVIVVTYLCDNNIRLKTSELNILGYFEKPVSFDKVLELINKK